MIPLPVELSDPRAAGKMPAPPRESQEQRAADGTGVTGSAGDARPLSLWGQASGHSIPEVCANNVTVLSALRAPEPGASTLPPSPSTTLLLKQTLHPVEHTSTGCFGSSLSKCLSKCLGHTGMWPRCPQVREPQVVMSVRDHRAL